MDYIHINIIRGRVHRYRRRKILLIRRNLRDNGNVFENTTEAQFMDLYRFPRHLCLDLLDKLKQRFFLNERQTAIPIHLRFLCALRFFAVGNFQRTIGQDFLSCMSQTSVQRCIHEVANILNDICAQYVYFPDEREQRSIKEKFFSQFSFPGIIGLIDGTHIKIISPSTNIEHAYYCRKGGHSINLLIVCDSDYLIRYANAKFPGTSHDAYIWRRSLLQELLKTEYSEGKRNFWLLGDSGFPLQPWLMTPYGNPSNESELKYNIAHKSTRCMVERCIGILKSRFRCISSGSVLNYEPSKAGRIINACAVLHNILLKANVYNETDLLETETIHPDAEDSQQSANVDNGNETLREGQRIRQYITRLNFS